MENIIKIEAELDLEKNEVKIKIIQDEWADFGFFLEATGFMAYQAMKYKEWNEDKILNYARDYLQKCVRDYKIKAD